MYDTHFFYRVIRFVLVFSFYDKGYTRNDKIFKKRMVVLGDPQQKSLVHHKYVGIRYLIYASTYIFPNFT